MTTHENLWTFRLLTSLAHADGVFDPAERQMLEQLAKDIFESDSEIKSALKGIDSPEAIDSIIDIAPEQVQSQSYGFKTLALCIAIANADGEMHQSEKKFINQLGNFYRFEPDMVELLIQTHNEQKGG